MRNPRRPPHQSSISGEGPRQRQHHGSPNAVVGMMFQPGMPGQLLTQKMPENSTIGFVVTSVHHPDVVMTSGEGTESSLTVEALDAAVLAGHLLRLPLPG